jgi:hypothetical protein
MCTYKLSIPVYGTILQSVKIAGRLVNLYLLSPMVMEHVVNITVVEDMHGICYITDNLICN